VVKEMKYLQNKTTDNTKQKRIEFYQEELSQMME
jgi:hypothetical protein